MGDSAWGMGCLERPAVNWPESGSEDAEGFGTKALLEMDKELDLAALACWLC